MIKNTILDENNDGFKIGIKELIAMTLIILGITIGIWVFLNASKMFTNPENISSFQHLVKNNIDTTITIKEKETVKVIVAPELISYLIPILLLMLCVSVAGIFVAGGVKLLSPEIENLKKNLYVKFEKLRDDLSRNRNA
jgi:positive regulator of sigma E activity